MAIRSTTYGMGIVNLTIALLIWPNDANVYGAMVWLCWLPQALVIEVLLFMETDFFITYSQAWGWGKSLGFVEGTVRRNHNLANSTQARAMPAEFAKVQEEALRVAKAQAAAMAAANAVDGGKGEEEKGGQ